MSVSAESPGYLNRLLTVVWGTSTTRVVVEHLTGHLGRRRKCWGQTSVPIQLWER